MRTGLIVNVLCINTILKITLLGIVLVFCYCIIHFKSKGFVVKALSKHYPTVSMGQELKIVLVE